MNLTEELSRLRQEHQRFVRNDYHAHLGELIEQEGEDRALEIYTDLLTDNVLGHSDTWSGGMSASNIERNWKHSEEKTLLSEARRSFRREQLLRDAARAYETRKTEEA